MHALIRRRKRRALPQLEALSSEVGGIGRTVGNSMRICRKAAAARSSWQGSVATLPWLYASSFPGKRASAMPKEQHQP